MDEKTAGEGIPVHRPARPLSRLVRLLLHRNELRRSCDRIEGTVLVSLSAAFLTATVVAVLLAGHVYQSQHAAAAPASPPTAQLRRPAGPGARMS